MRTACTACILGSLLIEAEPEAKFRQWIGMGRTRSKVSLKMAPIADMEDTRKSSRNYEQL